MANVRYEILTKVGKAYFGKTLRSYVFKGQIIITDMTEHNFAQLRIPTTGTTAIIPIKEHIQTRKEKTAMALKIAITKRMNAIKALYEKRLREVPDQRKSMILTASGNYKEQLSTREEL